MVKVISNQRVFRTTKTKVKFVFYLIGSTTRAIPIFSSSLADCIRNQVLSHQFVVALVMRNFTNFLLSAFPLVNQFKSIQAPVCSILEEKCRS